MKIIAEFEVDSESSIESQNLVNQMMVDYYKHYYDSKVESMRIVGVKT